jgi:hypothetical protein
MALREFLKVLSKSKSKRSSKKLCKLSTQVVQEHYSNLIQNVIMLGVKEEENIN